MTMESSVPTGILKIGQTVAIRRLSDLDTRYYHGMIADIVTEKNGGKLLTVIYHGDLKPYKIQSINMLCRVTHDDIDIQHDYHDAYENDDGDDDGDDNYFSNSRSINSKKTRSSTRVQKGTITKKNDEIDSNDDKTTNYNQTSDDLYQLSVDKYGSDDDDNDVQMILDGNNKDHNLDNGIKAKEYNSEPNIQVHDSQDRYFEERDWHERHGDINYLDEIIEIDDKDDTRGDCDDNWEKKWHSEIKKRCIQRTGIIY